ncbi:MAG: hypothetical protein KDD50_02075 [Bdellovibrionales bacterium]|nr:hypothetical protein [Bdellovibrionales bacterium]
MTTYKPRYFFYLLIITSLFFQLSCSSSQKKKIAPQKKPSKSYSWTIDLDMKMQFGYFPQAPIPHTKQTTPPLALSNDKSVWSVPANTLALWGYPIPMKNKGKFYYEKYFNYPKNLSPLISANRTFGLFQLQLLNKYYLFKKHVESDKNFLVALIKVDNAGLDLNIAKTFPPLPNPKVIYQEAFDKQIMYSRVFIKSKLQTLQDQPLTDLELSQLGLNAFYDDLLEKYQKNLKLLQKDSRYYYFLGDSLNFKVKIIKLPIKITKLTPSFASFRLPVVSKSYFMSATLPIISEEFESNQLENLEFKDYDTLKENFRLIETHILEVSTAYKEN